MDHRHEKQEIAGHKCVAVDNQGNAYIKNDQIAYKATKEMQQKMKIEFKEQEIIAKPERTSGRENANSNIATPNNLDKPKFKRK